MKHSTPKIAISDHINANHHRFTEIRRKIHQHPELGFEEKSTSKLVIDTLSELGYEIDYGMAKTGVVATLKSGSSSRTIGIRADMDALPMDEHSGKKWSSQHQGKFHGCGHDGHTATLLAAADYLAKTRHFDGTIHLIFQPAEELLYGGKVMLDDGLFEKYPCDAIFALHNMPSIKTNKFCFKTGAMMASCDTLHIDIKGTGGHGAMPEKCIDATMVACYTAIALQTIVSRNVSPADAAVVTIGSIEAGKAPNIINDSAHLKLSVRTLEPEIRKRVLQRITEIATTQAASFGASATVTHINGCPSTVNGQQATEFAANLAIELFGAEMVDTNAAAVMGSEDFAFMLESNPNGCFFFVGAGDEPGGCMVHNPGYDFNDQLIAPAAIFWCHLVERYLAK